MAGDSAAHTANLSQVSDVGELRHRVADLEAENETLRALLDQKGKPGMSADVSRTISGSNASSARKAPRDLFLTALERTSDAMGFPSVKAGDDAATEEAFQQSLLEQMEGTPRLAPKLFSLEDVAGLVKECAQSLVEDHFTRCFVSSKMQPWNWNFYLWPIWAFGVFVRYFFLLPIRICWILCTTCVFIFSTETVIAMTPLIGMQRRLALQRYAIKLYCAAFVTSWSGVVQYHGMCPSRKSNQIFVANHTSMIDLIVLEQLTCFAVVGQKHKGWVGFMQDRYLKALGSLWFNRTESSDRRLVAERLSQHIADPKKSPMLIFPEGTCVNNEYCVMFKKGAFELGATVVPIAMKYNKLFSDAFWNSRKEGFTKYLIRLMSSWAIVCDVWFLEPMKMSPDETSVEFAERVKKAIAKKAGLTPVPWDGYYKYLRPSIKLTQQRQKVFADTLIKRTLSTANLASMAADYEQDGTGVHHRHL